MSDETKKRNKRLTTTGKVVGSKMDKTIAVQVSRLERHKVYGKYIRRYTKFYAHDDQNQAKLGDVVEIMQTRPLSKLKRWRLVRVVQAAPELS